MNTSISMSGVVVSTVGTRTQRLASVCFTVWLVPATCWL